MQLWKEFRVAVSFLTTLPLKYKGEWDERSFSRSAIFFPVVGLIIGLLTALVMYLVDLTGFHQVAAFTGLLCAVVISGGLHLDGYMDMCDGLLASRGPERALEIMKDSRVGSFAVIGVVFLLLFKFLLYASFITTPIYIITIITGLTLSRFLLDLCMLFFPCARKDGLAVMVQKYVKKTDLFFGAAILVVLLIIGGSWSLLPALILTVAVIMGITQGINKFLGGITGDIQGAMAEMGEALFLFFTLIFYAVLK